LADTTGISASTRIDPENTHWGALRVFNDDVVAGRGLRHPHRDAESSIRAWRLEHKDSMGTRRGPSGQVQVMSAGSHHALGYNPSPTTVHLMQPDLPRTRGSSRAGAAAVHA
jgi:redox-sensitive bicupin YhaK (pirin superfamily)